MEEHRTCNAEAGISNIPSGSSRCSSVGEQSHGKRPMSVRFAPLAPESPSPVSLVGDAPDRKSQFESGTGLHPGKAQRGLSTRPIIERPLVRPQLPGPGLMRASEPVSCWPHKPCEWRSTRQPATSSLGESFNGRTAGLQPANEGSIPSSSTKFRQGGRCGQGAGLKSRTSTFDSCSWHQV